MSEQAYFLAVYSSALAGRACADIAALAEHDSNVNESVSVRVNVCERERLCV